MLDILEELRRTGSLDDKALAKIIHRHNKLLAENRRHYSKKRLLPYYLKVKDTDLRRWESWGIDEVLENQLFKALQVKPRRTASGVATITVITKPWKCSSNCIYCPNDLRMPKSYLSDEPACQRAERNFFDPYLQVVSRLRALTHMGHPTEKIELIVLGGTWSDYPKSYQTWFVSELFRALNDGEAAEMAANERRRSYKDRGLPHLAEDLAGNVAPLQNEVDHGKISYNQAMTQLYGKDSPWGGLACEQDASLDELHRQHEINEGARHRVVGLVIETRPDTISIGNLVLLRELGCTKIQMGIQSLDPKILAANGRDVGLDTIHEAFDLLRIFGFKIHAHFMVNLYGATPEKDKQDYLRFVTEKPYQPDEVKLYPCALVKGTGLCAHYADRSWQPYTEEELLDVLTADTIATPPFMRISRMIRDISAHDIVAGNKKTNLRQLVENTVRESGNPISEIRYREISTEEASVEDLVLDSIIYETGTTHEHFLQWATVQSGQTLLHDRERIAGFLRLSLPDQDYIRKNRGCLPIGLGEAMIREVHIYGKAAKLHSLGEGAQHQGLGRQLVEKACGIAKSQGYSKVNVISAVGTRKYYRSLGFTDKGLYQQRTL